MVGAGYVAVELAGVFQGLGTETHLFLRHEKALRKFTVAGAREHNRLGCGLRVFVLLHGRSLAIACHPRRHQKHGLLCPLVHLLRQAPVP